MCTQDSLSLYLLLPTSLPIFLSSLFNFYWVKPHHITVYLLKCLGFTVLLDERMRASMYINSMGLFLDTLVIILCVIMLGIWSNSEIDYRVWRLYKNSSFMMSEQIPLRSSWWWIKALCQGREGPKQQQRKERAFWKLRSVPVSCPLSTPQNI